MSSSIKRASEERTGSKQPALSAQNVLVWSRNYMRKQNYTEQNAEVNLRNKNRRKCHIRKRKVKILVAEKMLLFIPIALEPYQNVLSCSEKERKRERYSWS